MEEKLWIFPARDQEAESRLLAWGEFLQVSDSGEEGKVSSLQLRKLKN